MSISSLPQSGPRVEIVAVTPELARKWLGANTNNRNVRSGVVRAYATDMAARQWTLTGDPIRFDITGELIDGQHRLLACIEASVPFETFVAYGLAPIVKRDVDRGAKRSLADTLKWMGEINVTHLATAINVNWRWDNGQITSTTAPTQAQALAWFEANSEVRHVINTARPLQLAPLRMPVTTASAITFRTRKIDAEAAELFVYNLREDANHASDDPTLILRRWLINQAIDRDRVAGHVVLAHTVKAWNAFITGSSIRSLSWRTTGSMAESFPDLLKMDGTPYPFPEVKARRERERAERGERQRAVREERERAAAIRKAEREASKRAKAR